ncbi:MAG: TIGR00645 family protein [Phycisphaerales bacterium]
MAGEGHGQSSGHSGAEPPRVGENVLERFLFGSRWILAPFYLGLVLSMVALLVQFGREMLHLFEHMTGATAVGGTLSSEAQTTIYVLSLIDIVLMANLVLMVILSGYENSVSRLNVVNEDRPSWLGKLDASGLKQKVFNSIVAISAIQLLRVFLQAGQASEKELWASAAIHMVFVVSALCLALSDRVSAGAKKPEK